MGSTRMFAWVTREELMKLLSAPESTKVCRQRVPEQRGQEEYIKQWGLERLGGGLAHQDPSNYW